MKPPPMITTFCAVSSAALIAFESSSERRPQTPAKSAPASGNGRRRAPVHSARPS
jgi:hypothetical protein